MSSWWFHNIEIDQATDCPMLPRCISVPLPTSKYPTAFCTTLSKLLSDSFFLAIAAMLWVVLFCTNRSPWKIWERSRRYWNGFAATIRIGTIVGHSLGVTQKSIHSYSVHLMWENSGTRSRDLHQPLGVGRICIWMPCRGYRIEDGKNVRGNLPKKHFSASFQIHVRLTVNRLQRNGLRFRLCRHDRHTDCAPTGG